MKLRRHAGDERARTPARRVWAAPLAAMAVVAAALVVAGCGSANSSAVAGGTGTSASAAAAAGNRAASRPGSQTNALKFVRCLRSHGVSDFPDPSSNGQLTIPPDDRNTSAFQRASKACQTLMPGAGGAEQTPTMSRAQELKLAECIRSHGVPNFPDPNASGAVPPNSVNVNSPKFRSALQACQPNGATPPPGAAPAP
jgi:hypothetical protein